MGYCIQPKFNSVLHFCPMKKYDYKHLSCSLPSGVDDMMKQIQKLGKEGWELVSVCPTSSSEYGLDMVTAFLKKEIS